jgi:hypothetical protein
MESDGRDEESPPRAVHEVCELREETPVQGRRRQRNLENAAELVRKDDELLAVK